MNCPCPHCGQKLDVSGLTKLPRMLNGACPKCGTKLDLSFDAKRFFIIIFISFIVAFFTWDVVPQALLWLALGFSIYFGSVKLKQRAE
jgi:uncharacterized protein (DUF983 family)